jgi:hypothetical protein
MVEFDIQNYNGKIYLRKELRKILNKRELKALANAKTIILFPADVDLVNVKKSLKIILADLDLRLKGGGK